MTTLGRMAREQRAMEDVADRFVSGERRYSPRMREELASVAAEQEVLARPGAWTSLVTGEWEDLVAKHLARGDRALTRAGDERHSGWRVPADQRNTWPIYATEAVTFTTEWGPVTVGRSLARIYDLDGWPDAVTLETMARQQAAREGVPA